MSNELAIAILAGSVTALGWLENHILGERTERRRQQMRAQLEHTTQQLEELYAPTAILLIGGGQVFSDILGSLGRRFMFREKEPLPAVELKSWRFWLENSFYLVIGESEICCSRKLT